MSHTGNPRHPNNPPSDYPQESTGAVTKDSLASESIRAGGAFGDNENADIMGVRGDQSTLATEDTTNANTLPAATSRYERDGDDETQYPDAEAGQGFTGTTSDQGYRGGSTFADTTTTGSQGSDSSYTPMSTGTGVRPQVDQAPNYTGDFTDERNLQPKGDNLIEGGDVPEGRNTYTGDVGGPKDPGRLAERDFQKMDADSSGGIGSRQYGNVGRKGDGTAFDALDSSERA